MKRLPSTRVISTRSAGRGGGLFTVNVEPDDYSLQSGPVEEEGEGNKTMDLNSLQQSPGPLSGQYVPTEDVVATLDDGRTIQLAVKGVPIPITEAFQRGLVDADGKPIKQAQAKAVGPSETKETPAKGSAPSQSAPADEAGAK